MANCKSCGAEIIWIKTEGGKAMPIDAKPEKVYLSLTGKTMLKDGTHEIEAHAKWIMVDGYKSHFATCPDAAQHRKGKYESE